MPTYEYRCANGHEFELFQRMSDEPAAECPECGAPSERLLSAGAGLLFKGSGFYITDYRSDDYKKKAGSDGDGSAKKSTSSDDTSKKSADSGKKSAGSGKSTGSDSGSSGGSSE